MNNMHVSTNTCIIHWKQWWGKTIFAVLLASEFIKKRKLPKTPEMTEYMRFFTPQNNHRVYWNIDIFEHDINITNRIDSIDTLSSFKYEKKPWIVLFDEVWLNFNSKQHWSEKNQTLSKFFFLVRKFNLSSIFISQRFGSVPVDMRELVDYIFEVKSIHRKGLHPIFSITRQSTDNEWNLVFEEERQFDIIKYLQIHWISYNTLESSIIE